jgi:RND family efflux transporter MFP subunit
MLDRVKRAGLSLLAAISLCGCMKPPAQQMPPPATVTVSTPLQRDVVEWDVYTGHLESPKSVNVAARVSGLLIAAPFVEGSVVKEGQVLFEIDPRPFQADLDAKIADEAKAKAQVDVAKANFDREAAALAGNAVSKQDYDNAKATLEQAQAAVAGAKAAEESSRLNLDWCHVTSPISGRVSFKNVTVGNLVNGGAGTATLLTTVESVDPMYCYVDVDENSVLKYQKLAIERKRVSAREARISCYVQLGNETNFPHKGYVDFVDNHVDPSTGTLKARGILPNPTGDLTPGFFASMRVPGSGQYSALLVPDSAVMTDQDRRNLLVVGPDNMVQVKQVQLGALFGSLRAIASGIDADDKVIINGQMHARPGAPVAPVDGTIAVNPGDFTQMGASTMPGHPSSVPAETDESRSTDASNAAAQLHELENGGPGAASTQPEQPIMEITSQIRPPTSSESTATDFSAPTSVPTTEPTTETTSTTMPATTMPADVTPSGAGQ